MTSDDNDNDNNNNNINVVVRTRISVGRIPDVGADTTEGRGRGRAGLGVAWTMTSPTTSRQVPGAVVTATVHVTDAVAGALHVDQFCTDNKQQPRMWEKRKMQPRRNWKSRIRE